MKSHTKLLDCLLSPMSTRSVVATRYSTMIAAEPAGWVIAAGSRLVRGPQRLRHSEVQAVSAMHCDLCASLHCTSCSVCRGMYREQAYGDAWLFARCSLGKRRVGQVLTRHPSSAIAETVKSGLCMIPCDTPTFTAEAPLHRWRLSIAEQANNLEF